MADCIKSIRKILRRYEHLFVHQSPSPIRYITPESDVSVKSLYHNLLKVIETVFTMFIACGWSSSYSPVFPSRVGLSITITMSKGRLPHHSFLGIPDGSIKLSTGSYRPYTSSCFGIQRPTARSVQIREHSKLSFSHPSNFLLETSATEDGSQPILKHSQQRLR